MLLVRQQRHFFDYLIWHVCCQSITITNRGDDDHNCNWPEKDPDTISKSYKNDALALAERISFAKAATQLGVQESQLYYWKNKLRQQQNSSDREQLLADENTRLKRLLAEQAES